MLYCEYMSTHLWFERKGQNHDGCGGPKGGIVTKHDITELLKITPSKAYAIIRQLQKDGKIELLYGGKYSKYRVVKQ